MEQPKPKSRKALALLALAVAGALAASFAPKLSPVCAAVDPELVEEALSPESEGGSSSGPASAEAKDAG